MDRDHQQVTPPEQLAVSASRCSAPARSAACWPGCRPRARAAVTCSAGADTAAALSEGGLKINSEGCRAHTGAPSLDKVA